MDLAMNLAKQNQQASGFHRQTAVISQQHWRGPV